MSMLFSFNEQWSIACWGKLNSPKGTYLEWWKRLILKTTHFQERTKACAWRSLSLAKMISNGLDSMQNKLIVSGRVGIQNSNNASRTMQNGRGTEAPCLQQILSVFLVVGYTCLLFNCHGAMSLSLSLSVILLFLTLHIPFVFPSLPISLTGILPCLIHVWHACFTHHVPTAMLCRPEGFSTKPACNLLTHRATSSQLSSSITLNSWNGPLSDMRLVVIIMSFKESSNTAYMFMSYGEVIGWVLNVGGLHQADKSASLNLTVGLLNARLEALVTSTHCLTIELIHQVRDWKLCS